MLNLTCEWGTSKLIIPAKVLFSKMCRFSNSIWIFLDVLVFEYVFVFLALFVLVCAVPICLFMLCLFVVYVCLSVCVVSVCLSVLCLLGVERECAVSQEFLIFGVLWGYFECIHFSEIIMVLLNHLILFPQYYSGVGEDVIARKSQYLKELYFVILNPVPELFHFQ